jgi:hypothetical protein
MNDKFNPIYGIINVGAFILLCALIVLASKGFAIVPVATVGCGAFGALIQRAGKVDYETVAGFAIIGLVCSMLWFLFGI